MCLHTEKFGEDLCFSASLSHSPLSLYSLLFFSKPRKQQEEEQWRWTKAANHYSPVT